MGRDISTEEKGSITSRDKNTASGKYANFEVPYLGENISRCRCSHCPVQADSQCAQDKIKISKEAMEYMPTGDVPKQQYIPGVYCSAGESSCKDLNFDRQCICGSM